MKTPSIEVFQAAYYGVQEERMRKREKRVKRELRRHGTPAQGHGWAAKQAAKKAHRRTKHESWK